MNEIETIQDSDIWANKILLSMYFFIKNDISMPSLLFTPQHHHTQAPIGNDYVYVKTVS